MFFFADLLRSGRAHRYDPLGGELDYEPEAFTATALEVAAQAGWLAIEPTPALRRRIAEALDGLSDLGLDEEDVYPFGILHELTAARVLVPVPGLAAQLTSWRRAEARAHGGEVLERLSLLAEEDAAPGTP